MPDTQIARWLMPWRRKPAAPTQLPLGITEPELQALNALRASPHFAHYLRIIERLGEQQASTLASGVPHEKYLFASGALTALRRVYTLVDDIIAAATQVEEHAHARERKHAIAARRHADTFVNTPWYDGWRTDAVDRSSK